MPRTFQLLLPEWQAGPSDSVHRGACWLAAELMDGQPDAVVHAPAEEHAPDAECVHALSLIARHCAEAAATLDAHRPSRLLTIGGTCGVEVAPVAYLNRRYAGDLAVLWFDAHADMNTPASSPSGNFHGMVLRTLLGEGPAAMLTQIARPLAPSQVFLIGVRDRDRAEAMFIGRSGLSSYPVTQSSTQQLVTDLRRAGLRHLYIHFDVDVINPEEFPDALMHAPGGPSLAQLEACLQQLSGDFEVVGLSVVEVRGEPERSRRLLADMLRRAGLVPPGRERR